MWATTRPPGALAVNVLPCVVSVSVSISPPGTAGIAHQFQCALIETRGPEPAGESVQKPSSTAVTRRRTSSPFEYHRIPARSSVLVSWTVPHGRSNTGSFSIA